MNASTVGPADAAALAARIIGHASDRGLTIAVAESLTGGLVTAELTAVAGASAVLLGGVVAYRTELKRSMLGVSSELLAAHGPVHPDVATQLAANVRHLLAVDGRAADIGIATTGVAGPGPHDGHPAGTAFVGVAVGADVRVVPLRLSGSRADIRNAVVYESLSATVALLGIG